MNYLQKRLPLFVCAVVGALLMFVSPEVFAQETSDKVQFVPLVDFSTVFTSIRTAIGPIVVGALGIALALWACWFFYGLIRKMGR